MSKSKIRFITSPAGNPAIEFDYVLSKEEEQGFGRWLAEVKAQAWAEGAIAVHQYFDYFPNRDIPRNPYDQGENND